MSDDGVTFDNMLCVHGEVPPRRFNGKYKDFGPQYNRCIEEGNGQYEIHQIMLAKKGIFLLENMNTGPLAKEKVYEFLFVLGQPRITGAVQAIVNPVAIY